MGQEWKDNKKEGEQRSGGSRINFWSTSMRTNTNNLCAWTLFPPLHLMCGARRQQCHWLPRPAQRTRGGLFSHFILFSSFPGSTVSSYFFFVILWYVDPEERENKRREKSEATGTKCSFPGASRQIYKDKNKRNPGCWTRKWLSLPP